MSNNQTRLEGLSILIPIYNRDVTKLVQTLIRQCKRQKLAFEILCFDDLSTEKYKQKNKVLSSYFGVNYTELSENKGRAKIRNWLAKSAIYETLLFLDCDSKINNRLFIQNYLSYIGKKVIVNGGRNYTQKKPRAKSKILHWKYGNKYESKSAKYRNRNATTFFHSNNFLIDRKIIIDIPFDESIVGYGYEDLLIAQTFKDSGFEIIHIDNNIEHLGLEKSKTFIEKAKTGVQNLAKLNNQNHRLNTRLEYWYSVLQDWHLEKFAFNVIKKRISSIETNLLGENPNLYYLQAYKLYHYISTLDSNS